MSPLRAQMGCAPPLMAIARMHSQPGGALPQRSELGTAAGRFGAVSQLRRPAGSARMCRAEAQHLGVRVRAGLRPRRAVRARQSSIAPNMPLPGDDQAAMIFSALSEAEGAAASAPRGAGGVAESSANGAGLGVRAGGAASTSGGGGGEGPEDQPQRIPHRWRVVGMMALAFILCNMDKARRAPARPSFSGARACRKRVLCGAAPERADLPSAAQAGRPARAAQRPPLSSAVAPLSARRPPRLACASAAGSGRTFPLFVMTQLAGRCTPVTVGLTHVALVQRGSSGPPAPDTLRPPGEHERGGYPHGEGARLERDGSRPGVLCVLLGVRSALSCSQSVSARPPMPAWRSRVIWSAQLCMHVPAPAHVCLTCTRHRRGGAADRGRTARRYSLTQIPAGWVSTKCGPHALSARMGFAPYFPVVLLRSPTACCAQSCPGQALDECAVRTQVMPATPTMRRPGAISPPSLLLRGQAAPVAVQVASFHVAA
jgi:hypothetical protein